MNKGDIVILTDGLRLIDVGEFRVEGEDLISVFCEFSFYERTVGIVVPVDRLSIDDIYYYVVVHNLCYIDEFDDAITNKDVWIKVVEEIKDFIYTWIFGK